MSGGKQWVGRIAAKDLVALADHRGLPGWELRVLDDGLFWLRVPFTDETVFRKLPLTGRWISDDQGMLVREGHSVPEALLPAEDWRKVSEFLTVSPPLRGSPRMRPPAVDFCLVADTLDHPAAALLCESGAFAAWAETAFSKRLECLHFALCDDGRALVTGLPLPAVPGTGFHQTGRLWLPCGYRLPDHVWPELLEEKLGLGNNRLALFHPDGSHEELDKENLVPVTRAAVRSSGRGIQAID